MPLADYGFEQGVIPVGQTQAIVKIPSSTRTGNYTAALASTSGARLIEFFADGSATRPWTPDYDVDQTGQIVAVSLGPITHIRFTGAAGDTYRVQA